MSLISPSDIFKGLVCSLIAKLGCGETQGGRDQWKFFFDAKAMSQWTILNDWKYIHK